MRTESMISEMMSSAAIGSSGVRHAVVALELGAADEAVLSYVDFLAAQLPFGSIRFMHVLPAFDLFNALYEREQEGLVSNFELNREVIARMEEKIRQRLSTMDFSQVSLDVKEGNPLEELLRETEQTEAGLIVIGQRSGVDHHGILARNLIRKAPCPALIIPDKAENRLRTIVVPVDFSASSVEALATALAIRKHLPEPPRIIALNVYDLPDFSVYKIRKTASAFQRAVEEDRQEAFRDFLRTHFPHESDVIESVLIYREEPGIASYILDYAGDQEADLIIMGAKGHSKVELLLLGSVTEKLLTANDRFPTWVVKAAKEG